MASRRPIPLPRQWKSHVKAGVLHAISLASVVIDTDSRLFLNGREITADRLTEGLQDLLGETPAGKRTVLLKVDREAKAKYFEPAIEAISAAGGDLIHVLEREAPPE